MFQSGGSATTGFSGSLNEADDEGWLPVTSTEKAGTLTYTALCHREGAWWVITVPELETGRVESAHRRVTDTGRIGIGPDRGAPSGFYHGERGSHRAAR